MWYIYALFYILGAHIHTKMKTFLGMKAGMFALVVSTLASELVLIPMKIGHVNPDFSKFYLIKIKQYSIKVSNLKYCISFCMCSPLKV